MLKKIEKLEKELQSVKLEINLLKDENNRLRLEAEKNKIVNDKDCTCSSIPSSKCNFKTGISNSRKKQIKNQGLSMDIKENFYQQKK